MDSGINNNPTYSDYLAAGFVPLYCKGYHPKYNLGQDYKTAKEPPFKGWNSPGYVPPTLEEMRIGKRPGAGLAGKSPLACMASTPKTRRLSDIATCF